MHQRVNLGSSTFFGSVTTLTPGKLFDVCVPWSNQNKVLRSTRTSGALLTAESLSVCHHPDPDVLGWQWFYHQFPTTPVRYHVVVSPPEIRLEVGWVTGIWTESVARDISKSISFVVYHWGRATVSLFWRERIASFPNNLFPGPFSKRIVALFRDWECIPYPAKILFAAAMLFLVVQFLYYFISTEAYKILVFSPTISRSHMISNGRIADELAMAGHDVVSFPGSGENERM